MGYFPSRAVIERAVYNRFMVRHRILAIALAAALGACGTPKSAEPPAAGDPDPGAGETPTPPPENEPSPSGAPVTDTFDTSLGKLTVQPIHHATLALTVAGKTIVVDPTSDAPEGWLPKADLVLITDIHGDHFDPDALAEVRKADTVIVGPPVVTAKLEGAKTLKNGESLDVLSIHIEAVPMYNLERGPEPGKLFHDKGRGNGYVLDIGGERVYLSGDTECTAEMRALSDIDLAFVCMNLPYTMPPDEAAACVKAFSPAVVIPYHYKGSDLATFSNALAGTDIDVRVRDFYASPE